MDLFRILVIRTTLAAVFRYTTCGYIGLPVTIGPGPRELFDCVIVSG